MKFLPVVVAALAIYFADAKPTAQRIESDLFQRLKRVLESHSKGHEGSKDGPPQYGPPPGHEGPEMPLLQPGSEDQPPQYGPPPPGHGGPGMPQLPPALLKMQEVTQAIMLDPDISYSTKMDLMNIFQEMGQDAAASAGGPGELQEVNQAFQKFIHAIAKNMVPFSAKSVENLKKFVADAESTLKPAVMEKLNELVTAMESAMGNAEIAKKASLALAKVMSELSQAINYMKPGDDINALVTGLKDKVVDELEKSSEESTESATGTGSDDTATSSKAKRDEALKELVRLLSTSIKK